MSTALTYTESSLRDLANDLTDLGAARFFIANFEQDIDLDGRDRWVMRSTACDACPTFCFPCHECAYCRANGAFKFNNILDALISFADLVRRGADEHSSDLPELKKYATSIRSESKLRAISAAAKMLWRAGK